MNRSHSANLWSLATLFRLAIPMILFCGQPALAAMQLDRTQVVFEAGAPARQDVVISNDGADPLYIKVEVLEVNNPGTPDETREVVTNPESIGFLATPNKLVVPPSSRRALRLINLNGHGETERVYRVNVTPVAPPAEAEGIGVRVIIAYQLLVFVKPGRSVVDLHGERDGRELRLQNRGNVNVLLKNGQLCLKAGACSELKGSRLYPGNERVLDIPSSARLSFDVEANGETTRREF